MFKINSIKIKACFLYKKHENLIYKIIHSDMPEYLPSKPKRSSKSSKKSTSQSSSITSLIKEGAVEKASLVPLDFQGRPLFPVKLENDSLIVFSIGEVGISRFFPGIMLKL